MGKSKLWSELPSIKDNLEKEEEPRTPEVKSKLIDLGGNQTMKMKRLKNLKEVSLKTIEVNR